MSSERRGAELLLLESIGAFRSLLLRVMVAVRRSWLQRGRGRATTQAAFDRLAATDFSVKRPDEAGKAEEKEMKTEELQRILGYLNIGLAIAHDSGVSIGHFGNEDFIQLAQTVNGMLLHSIAPARDGAGPGELAAAAPLASN